MTYARWFALASLLCACAPRAAQSAAPEPGNPAAGGAAAAAEAPPGTDIFLVEIRDQGPLPQVAGEPRNITRRAGYDNQPSFTPGGDAILFTSIRDGQADIYRYDLASSDERRITSTPESEYSPIVVPAGDAISVIRVEADSTQRLWRFPLGGGSPGLVLEDIRPVGYHAWADAATLALFVLGEPATLQIADTRTGTARIVARDIGRSLHLIPGSNAISFVDKSGGDEWWIRALDLASGDITPLVQTLPGSEDYAWTPAGTLLIAQGPTLHAWRQGGPGWVQLADFSSAGLEGITRLAVSPDGDRLALVAAAR